jgi:hypothetical protein
MLKLAIMNSWQIICNFFTVYLLKLYYLAMIAYLRNKMHKYSNQCSWTSNKRKVLSHSDHISYIEFNYFLLWTFSPLLNYPHEYDNSVRERETVWLSFQGRRLLTGTADVGSNATHLNLQKHMGRRGRDRMVVGFTTICAISAYHHSPCEFESR